MPKISSLAKQLSAAYPELVFKLSNDFRWSPEEKTVYFCSTGTPDELLHETAHGLLQHTDYGPDISLLIIERDAWAYASETLAPRFSLTINPDLVEDALDSYRDWLHARSLCPHCKQTGIQNSNNTYLCMGCDTSWRVNEARRCGLRRYQIKPNKIPAL